ncbi:ABC transporter ATP-binding protein [Fictibacillus enclensis]|uniref:ABC transporter ATP-binding protein n=1 Tax=Fictibacillus enclensis TaxID=1017270 RepID=UPI0024C009A2|nr:ABC transporter ATP-binding protein [Fictibacillus enclensis]WHY71000.1 ABC transporter ATP-binding protein [Fictibacillus enclensis]
MHSLRWIWGNLLPYRKRLTLGLLLVLTVACMNLINPYVAGKIVDRVIYGNQNVLLWQLLAIMIGSTLIRTGVRYGYQMLFENLSQNLIFMIREKLYDHLNQLEPGFYDRTKTGDIMARMTSDLEAVRHFAAWTIYMVVENLAILLFALCFMFYIHPPLALAMLAVTPVIGFFAYRLTKDVRPTFAEIRNQFARLNSVVQENISGNRVVKAFAKEEYEIKKFSAENKAFKEKNLMSSHVWGKYLPVLDSLAGVLTVVMTLAGGIMVIRGSLSLGELVTFNSLIWALNNPMRLAGWLINDVQRFIASAEKVEELLETEPQIKSITEERAVQPSNNVLEFDHVHFSYGDGPVLRDITFQAHAGETIGIIGPTGAGKSTLVDLLGRFYEVDAGEIRVDGINIKDWNIHQLREKMAMVMQDIFLFSDTIEGNIAYGNPDAPMDAVYDAAEKAEASRFIESLPKAYDTVVGERGVGLSGGQKQRIALARALLRDPSLLILDDTTSSVDMETEFKIQKTLKSILKDKTCFIIAHRISSVKDADMVLVMQEGCIIERGKHADLMKRKGYYWHVYNNQLGNFDLTSLGEEVI